MKRALLAATLACAVMGMAVKTAHAAIASEQYGWYDGMILGQETTSYGSGGSDCGSAGKTLCATVVTTRCTRWATTGQTGGGTIGPASGGVNAGYTKTCEVTETTTVYLYYP